MFVNCNADIICNSTLLKSVSSFKYLGIKISNNSSKPDAVLRDRIYKAKQAFNCIKANARMLSIGNIRVRV